MRKFNVKTKIPEDLYMGDLKDFSWLVEKLFSPSDKIKGCELLFVDAVFFNSKGKPKFIAKTEKDGCIICVKNPNKLKLPEVR